MASLREALRMLEVEDLISVTPGGRSGPMVHRPGAGSLAGPLYDQLVLSGTTIGELYDARHVLELIGVERLARQAKQEHVDYLLLLNQELRQAIHDEKVSLALSIDRRIHQFLTTIAGNSALKSIEEALFILLTHHQEQIMQERCYGKLRKDIILLGAGSLERLTELAGGGEVEKAINHWREHLNYAKSLWVSECDGETRLMVPEPARRVQPR